jgi:hypothetical protein
MRRHTQFDSRNQIPLALGSMEMPTSASALLEAYRQLEFSRHVSFEQVTADPAHATGVRNLADAIARRGIFNYTTNGTRTNIRPAQNTLGGKGLSS